MKDDQKIYFFLLLNKLPYIDIDIENNEANVKKLEKIVLLLDNIKYLEEDQWSMVIEHFDATWTGIGGM